MFTRFTTKYVSIILLLVCSAVQAMQVAQVIQNLQIPCAPISAPMHECLTNKVIGTAMQELNEYRKKDLPIKMLTQPKPIKKNCFDSSTPKKQQRSPKQVQRKEEKHQTKESRKKMVAESIKLVEKLQAKYDKKKTDEQRSWGMCDPNKNPVTKMRYVSWIEAQKKYKQDLGKTILDECSKKDTTLTCPEAQNILQGICWDAHNALGWAEREGQYCVQLPIPTAKITKTGERYYVFEDDASPAYTLEDNPCERDSKNMFNAIPCLYQTIMTKCAENPWKAGACYAGLQLMIVGFGLRCLGY